MYRGSMFECCQRPCKNALPEANDPFVNEQSGGLCSIKNN
ncbi:hypothetical protein VCHA50P420_160043 [Vibrio chagasii]|nr:hypothetical protein VCHA50P420_160043 [Vibrio chagasii]